MTFVYIKKYWGSFTRSTFYFQYVECNHVWVDWALLTPSLCKHDSGEVMNNFNANQTFLKPKYTQQGFNIIWVGSTSLKLLDQIKKIKSLWFFL